ncbi:hypothetical protein B9Z55_006321 [Caenorhabditis nigoni]|uniref:Ionotropic glutamate receptor L-glutamate and glycine-binding domain-containing protein n=1 Tax=Caenorhabditis nigoni TaxID=1611254 RepID=A0A2G5V4K7_9PELO|nr:hypothetical protein B9Z55_006321 [Caenorhabditis nigoni]
MAGVRPHLKIGVDSSLNNKGSTFKIGYQVGLEIEQCETLMKALQWTYEFVQYNNQIGHVLENGTATGMLGDIQKGRIDMACGRFRMTADRARILTFTYPTQLEVNQVYLITDPLKSEDVGFLFRPFSTFVWFLLSITILIVSATFFVLRAVEFKSTEGLTTYVVRRLLYPSIFFSRCIQNSISQVLLSTFNLEIRVKNKSTFFAFHLFSAIWLLAWFHVFVDLYTSELSGMMVVSDKKHMPFEDFYGMVENLRKGVYRLFTPSSDRLPECPREIPPSKCIAMFSEILSRHPPEYGDVTRLNERDFVSSVFKALFFLQLVVSAESTTRWVWMVSSTTDFIKVFYLDTRTFPFKCRPDQRLSCNVHICITLVTSFRSAQLHISFVQRFRILMN